MKVPIPAGDDKNILVELTDENDLHCIRVILYDQTFLIHARSAIDLHYKLGLAILDWIARSSIAILEQFGLNLRK